MIFTGYWKVFRLNFSMMGNAVFFQPKSWCKNDIYLLFLSFLSYSRTREIWFFAQWFFFLYKYYSSILWWSLCNFLVILSAIKFSVGFEFLNCSKVVCFAATQDPQFTNTLLKHTRKEPTYFFLTPSRPKKILPNDT